MKRIQSRLPSKPFIKTHNTPHIPFIGILLLVFVSLSCSLSTGIYPSQPESTQETLFNGIKYKRNVTKSPRPMVIHIVTVNLKEPGLEVLVTPPKDKDAKKPLSARTTSEFLTDFQLQMAINGDGFTPWHDWGPLGYFPHPGDLVKPNGFAVSRGIRYTPERDQENTLYIYATGRASINSLTGKVYNAISGDKLLMRSGEILPGLSDLSPQPRTAIGLNRAGTQMIIVIVDGRQSGYSEGATLKELANILLNQNAFNALNMDGGGSSTLVIADKNGNPVVLNSPIHNGNPGALRPVGNHIGFWIK